jgi:hypothetical protein
MKKSSSGYHSLFSYMPSPSKSKSMQGGLTLVELLIAVLLLPVVIILVSQIFISQVKSERSLLGAQSSENLRSRLSFLLESDIADGEAVLIASSSCPTVAGELFSIKSPYLDSSGVLQYACITYSSSNGALFRSGPAIQTNGSLDLATLITQEVAANVQITDPTISTSGTKVDFNIVIPGFLGATSSTYSVSYGTKNFRVGT